LAFTDYRSVKSLNKKYIFLKGVLTSIFVGAITPASSLIFRGITDVLMEGQHNLENGNLDMDDFSKKSV